MLFNPRPSKKGKKKKDEHKSMLNLDDKCCVDVTKKCRIF